MSAKSCLSHCHSLLSYVAFLQRGVLFIKDEVWEQELHTPRLYYYGSVLDVKVSSRDLVGLSTDPLLTTEQMKI
jgi:hypothetical protein